MKRCPECGTRFESVLASCPGCGFTPSRIAGFPAYSPALAHGGGGFKEGYFENLARLEAANFWFQARNRLIIRMLARHCPGFRSMLEIGCGTGFVLQGIAESFTEAFLHGSEIFIEGLGFAALRVPRANFMQMDARQIPFEDEFEVIGAFDVLEHIEEDENVLSQIHTALQRGGMLLLTVPQHRWLWSTADDYAMHVRRYSGRELHRKLLSAGFTIVRSTSFVSLLLPAMMASRLTRRHVQVEDFDAESELTTPGWIDPAFRAAMTLELALIGAGVDLPAGGSRFVIARRS